MPVQFSAGSHSPKDARQTTLAAAKASGGQAADSPSHFSSTSHPPGTAGRQMVPAGATFATAGQVSVDPSQYRGSVHSTTGV